MCADFRIYNCIMYHLMSNAIKHCPRNTTIGVDFSFCSRAETDPA